MLVRVYICVCVFVEKNVYVTSHVRSVYISILGKRVSIPAGEYTSGWEKKKHGLKLKGG